VRAHDTPQLYQRTPGGAWWVYWRGERWSTRERDRVKADRVVRERLDPRHAAASQRTVVDAIALLHEALARRGRSQATRDQAVEKLGHFVRLWGAKRLHDIDADVLAAYIDERLTPADPDVRPVARLTVSHELGYLRQCWKLARSRGWCPRAWDELMPERFDRGYRPRTRWLTPEELRAVLASLPPDKGALVAWIVATGSDVGDLARAQADDLDWRRGLVRVRGTKTVFRDRYVPITPLTRPLLKLAETAGPPFRPWPWINGALRKLAVRLGIPHFTPKDLRRTHGQWLRSSGVDPHLIGRVLGHADSAMADRVYAQGDELAIARLVQEAVRRTNGVRISRARGAQRAPAARGTRRK
jgi:integrase